MSTRETYTITESSAYIIITYSGGDVRQIPKRNLTVVHKPDKNGDYKVYLNWPAGDYPNATDNIYLDYSEVSSPSFANNTAMVTWFQEMVDNAIGASSAGGAGGGSIVYTNAANDFTATANDGTKTITITGLPFTLEAIHVVGGSIKKIDANDEVSDLKLTDVAVSGGVITLANEDDFVSTDTVYVTLIGPDKWYDRDQDTAKTITQNPPYAHYIDPVSLVTDSDVGDEFGTWTDQGSEISCQSYNELCIFVDFTVNDSTLCELRILAKHESGGSEEYEVNGWTDVDLGSSNSSVCYKYDLSHVLPYLQIQTKSGFAETGSTTTSTTTVGHTNGTVSITYTLGYK